MPYGTPFADIAALAPDGVIVSPGPGDPANLDDGLDVVRCVARHEDALLRHLPRTSIAGAGDRRRHRVSSSSVTAAAIIRSSTPAAEHVSITAQNHGFVVETDSLADAIAVGESRWSI